jgi:hypothetical protein
MNAILLNVVARFDSWPFMMKLKKV